MIAALKAGDRIITTGGIIATVTAVREKSLLVRSADKSILEVTRASVAGMQGEEEKAS
jgi:preprotein translocase subunit YajC